MRAKPHPSPRTIASADFNTDGKADLVVLEMENNRVALYLGAGNGGFGSPVFFDSVSILVNESP